MIHKSKLLFAFPVMKKENMSKEYLSTPCEFFRGIKAGSKQSVMVTFGVMASESEPVSVLIGVTRMGCPNLDELADSESFYENLRVNLLPDNKGIYLVTIEIRNVRFDADGLYEIESKIFPSGSELTDANVIDTIKSYFYVQTIRG